MARSKPRNTCLRGDVDCGAIPESAAIYADGSDLFALDENRMTDVDRNRIRDAVKRAKLTKIERHLLRLRFEEDLVLRDIAAEFQVSPMTIKTWVDAALARHPTAAFFIFEKAVCSHRMKFNLKAKGMTLTPAIKAAVAKAMAALELKTKRYGTSVTGEVELMKTTKHHKKGDVLRAEIHVRLPNALVYAEAELDDLYKAIIAARREAEAQIAKYKGTHQKSKKREPKTKRA